MTLIALAGAGLAAERAWRVWSNDSKAEKPVTLDLVAPSSASQDTVVLASHRWPALFGELQPPAPSEPPAPEPVAEPQPPKPPAPPLESLGFVLTGVVRAGDGVWGLVSHPTGQKIFRVGDLLTDGFTITDIDEQGLWIDDGGEEPVLLGFPEG